MKMAARGEIVCMLRSGVPVILGNTDFVVVDRSFKEVGSGRGSNNVCLDLQRLAAREDD
jgi:hypothetical protein